MKVEFGEGTRAPGAVTEDRHQIHGYSSGSGAGVARSEAPSSNRAVAVVQQQGEVGAASSGGAANGRTGGGADGGGGRPGLPIGVRATTGLVEGAAVLTVQHDGGTRLADTSALVGSGKYRQQVGDLVFFFVFSRARACALLVSRRAACCCPPRLVRCG